MQSNPNREREKYAGLQRSNRRIDRTVRQQLRKARRRNRATGTPPTPAFTWEVA